MGGSITCKDNALGVAHVTERRDVEFSAFLSIAVPASTAFWEERGAASGGPDFKLELTMTVDHFEIGTVGSDEAGAMRLDRERNEHSEMQVAKFLCGKPSLRAHFPQQLSRLQPIPCRRSEDGMITLQRPQEFTLCWLSRATPQLRQYYRRCPDQPAD